MLHDIVWKRYVDVLPFGGLGGEKGPSEQTQRSSHADFPAYSFHKHLPSSEKRSTDFTPRISITLTLYV